MDRYRARLLEALAYRGYSDSEIEGMTWQAMFDEFCQWEGLISYGPTLRGVMAAAKKEEREWNPKSLRNP